MKNMLMIDRSFTKPTNFRIEVRNFYRIIASLTSTYGYKLTPKRFYSYMAYLKQKLLIHINKGTLRTLVNHLD